MAAIFFYPQIRQIENWTFDNTCTEMLYNHYLSGFKAQPQQQPPPGRQVQLHLQRQLAYTTRHLHRGEERQAQAGRGQARPALHGHRLRLLRVLLAQAGAYAVRGRYHREGHIMHSAQEAPLPTLGLHRHPGQSLLPGLQQRGQHDHLLPLERPVQEGGQEAAPDALAQAQCQPEEAEVAAAETAPWSSHQRQPGYDPGRCQVRAQHPELKPELPEPGQDPRGTREPCPVHS